MANALQADGSTTGSIREQIAAAFILDDMFYLPSDYYNVFRESVSWPSAKESFEAAWKDAKEGRVYPIDTLWDGIDVD